jgi:hypothetical protein
MKLIRLFKLLFISKLDFLSLVAKKVRPRSWGPLFDGKKVFHKTRQNRRGVPHIPCDPAKFMHHQNRRVLFSIDFYDDASF